jgi:DNA polymerase-1
MIKLITNQTSIDTPYEIVSLQDCINYCSTKKVLGLDIETTRKFNKWFKIEGLDPYTSDIVMLQIGDIDVQFIIDTRSVNIANLLPILINPNITLVGHNIKFEYKHILKKYKVRINALYDTMVAEKLLFNGYPMDNSLKALNERYLGITVDKTIRLSFLTIGDRPFTTEEIKYGAEDIELPLKIREFQLKDAQNKNLVNVFKLEFRTTAAIGEMEFQGMNFNSKKWLQTYQKNLIKYKEKTKELDNYVLINYPNSPFVNRQLDMFNPGFTCAIQWTSSKQVVAFFKFLKCCPMAKSKSTKKLVYTVEAKEVESLLVTADLKPEVKEFVKLYLATMEYSQAVTTFGENFLKHINPITKRIHSNYNQVVNTGRMSSSSPNQQNIPSTLDKDFDKDDPRRDQFRYAFDAAPGCDMINADYSGQESVILVNKSLDPDLLAFYDGDFSDMHSYIASKLFPEELKGVDLNSIKDLHPDLRQIAKSAGFALAYGGNGFTIAKNLGLPAARGEAVFNDYFKAFPGLLDFFEKTKANSLRQGYILIDEISKRKFYYKDIKILRAADYRGDFKTVNRLQGAMERAAMNYPVQGEAGSITKYALVLIYEELYAKNLLDVVKMVATVHDEIILESLKKASTYAAEMLQRNMEKAGSLWCKRVPLKAEACIEQYWTH